MADWMILFIVIGVPIFMGISGSDIFERKVVNKRKYYLNSIAFNLFLLLLGSILILLVNANITFPFDKGYDVPEWLSSMAKYFFVFPLIFSLTPLDAQYFKDLNSDKHLFGCPIALIPNNKTDFLYFTTDIVLAVLTEELICRYLAFYALHKLFGINGDYLVLISAALFSFGHLYQGFKGLIATLIYGIILGKTYLLTYDIYNPIFLHLTLNLTVCVLAFKRMVKRPINRS